MESLSLFKGVLFFCNPVSVAIVLMIFFQIFYHERSNGEKISNLAPFLILGIGLFLSIIIPSLVLISGIDLGPGALLIMLSMLFSTIVSIFYFVYSLRKTAKISNMEKNNLSKKGHNVIILNAFFIINIIILVRIFYYFIDKDFLDNGVPIFFLLPEVFMLISILIVSASEFTKKIYNIPVLYFSLAFLRLVIQFLTGGHETDYVFYSFILRDLIFIVFSTILLMRYLKLFRKIN